tara:strand:+ start:205 stop:429 length:225 start_codon:yes stop_codon:yes gene_type:complete
VHTHPVICFVFVAVYWFGYCFCTGRFLAKRPERVWTKRVKYDVRKEFADSRLRFKGRFITKIDEELLSELLNVA